MYQRKAHVGDEEHASLLEHVEASPDIADAVESLANHFGGDSVLSKEEKEVRL